MRGTEDLLIEDTKLAGVKIITPKRFGDDRGFFSESWSRKAMEAAGLQGGYSRLPTRDEVITPEIREGFKRLLEEAKARAEVAA